VTDINATRGVADDPEELGQKQYLEVTAGFLRVLPAAFSMGTRDEESLLARKLNTLGRTVGKPPWLSLYEMQPGGHMAAGPFGNLIQSETAPLADLRK